MRLISGTSISTWPPAANTASDAARYTSVLPLPVTPFSMNAAYLPSDPAIADAASACAALSDSDAREASAGTGAT